jgi:hypothetical protein
LIAIKTAAIAADARTSERIFAEEADKKLLEAGI